MSDTCKPFVLTTVESLKRREELSLYRKRKAISGNRQMSKYVPEKLYSRIMSLLSDTELLESVLDHYSSIQPHPPIVKSGNRDSRTANKFFYAGKFAPLEDSLKKSSVDVYKDLRDGDLYPGVEYSTALISPFERNPDSSKSNSADGYKYLRPLLKRDGGDNVLKPGINMVCDTSDLELDINAGVNNEVLVNIVHSIETKHILLEESIQNINEAIAKLTSLVHNAPSYSGVLDTRSKCDSSRIIVSKNKAGDILVSDSETFVNLSEMDHFALKGYGIQNSLNTSTVGLPKLLSDKRFSIFLDGQISEYIEKNRSRPSLRELGRLSTANGFGLSNSTSKAGGNVDNRRVKRILESFHINY